MAVAAIDVLVDPRYRENPTHPKFERSLSYGLVARKHRAAQQSFIGEQFACSADDQCDAICLQQHDTTGPVLQPALAQGRCKFALTRE